MWVFLFWFEDKTYQYPVVSRSFLSFPSRAHVLLGNEVDSGSVCLSVAGCRERVPLRSYTLLFLSLSPVLASEA